MKVIQDKLFTSKNIWKNKRPWRKRLEQYSLHVDAFSGNYIGRVKGCTHLQTCGFSTHDNLNYKMMYSYNSITSSSCWAKEASYHYQSILSVESKGTSLQNALNLQTMLKRAPIAVLKRKTQLLNYISSK